MANITPTNIPLPEKYQSYGFNFPPNIQDFTNRSTVLDFESVTKNAIPLHNAGKNNIENLYKSKGKVNPEEESPTRIIDEGVKHVLNFGDQLIKQVGLLAEQQLNRQTKVNDELVDLILYGVNAILGIAQGGFSFNVYSIIGSVFSMVGFAGIGGLISSLGGAKDNMKKAQEEDKKVATETGKRIAAATKATADTIQVSEGVNVTMANVDHTSAQVVNIESNVSTTTRTPMHTVSAGSMIETATDKVSTINYYRGNHTYMTVQVDNASTFKTRHSTRYHSASLLEIAGQSEYIASSLSTYGDFRWTQTGQTVGSLPIANPIETLLGNLFQINSVPITGFNIDYTSFAKLTSAMFFNVNYGQLYTIDGSFVFINCGIGLGLAGIPPRQMPTIKDLEPFPTTNVPDPGSPVSVNDKTYETLYNNNEKFQNFNLGQLFTRIEILADELKDKYSNTDEVLEFYKQRNAEEY